MLLRHGAASPQGDPSQRSRKLFPAFGQIVSHLGLALSLGQLMGPSPISSTENVQAAQLLYCHTADSPPTFGGTEETFTSLPSPFWNKAAACISLQDWDQQRHCSWHNWFSLSLFSPARNSKSQQTPTHTLSPVLHQQELTAENRRGCSLDCAWDGQQGRSASGLKGAQQLHGAIRIFIPFGCSLASPLVTWRNSKGKL